MSDQVRELPEYDSLVRLTTAMDDYLAAEIGPDLTRLVHSMVYIKMFIAENICTQEGLEVARKILMQHLPLLEDLPQ